MSLMENLVHSSALVTGASKGIGLKTAEFLMAAGVSVTGLGRDFSAIMPAFDDVVCDLGNLAQLESLLPSFPTPMGTLVLNAGVGQFGGLEQFSSKQIQRLINVNLVSHLLIVKHYLPLMKRQGGGDIVIIGSESALQGARSGSVYCATKFALRGLAQSLRADCANSNIRVQLINPGPVNTGFFDDLNFAPQHGQEFALNADDVANVVVHTLAQPRHVVMDEINIQAMKRSFSKKKT